MPREKRCRRISTLPSVKGFAPFGQQKECFDEVIVLALEEYEAIKLADYEGLMQEEAALQMNVSRPTFTRIYEEARKKIAKALVEGKCFIIEGGNVSLDFESLRCMNCGKNWIIKKTESESIKNCPNCHSQNIFSGSDFFQKGPRCRKNWF